MTLTTHAIIGAATARVFSFNPVAAFFAAFASHFLIDALPHWDYFLRSVKKDEQNVMNNDMVIGKNSFVDLAKIGFDTLVGLILSYVIFQPAEGYDIFIVAIGAVAGILPDPLQFIYFKWRHEPMVSLQKFHMWIHTDLKLEGRWLSGSVLQIALIVACVTVSWYLTGDMSVPGL